MKATSPTNKLPEVSSLMTSADDALVEITKRRKSPKLFMAVEKYLNNDIPEHFQQNEPVAYLSRHLATPNFETLRFIDEAKKLRIPIVIGEDLDDKFVCNNCLKKSLGKLPILIGHSKNGDEIIEKHTIVDFNKYTGYPINKVKVLSGEMMTNFHREMFKVIAPPGVTVTDESAWVNRQNSTDRKNLLSYYKKILSLLIVHGIMFEFYDEEDIEFVDSILRPAFTEVEQKFGLKPLICELLTPKMEIERDWIAYPKEALVYAEKHKV